VHQNENLHLVKFYQWLKHADFCQQGTTWPRFRPFPWCQRNILNSLVATEDHLHQKLKVNQVWLMQSCLLPFEKGWTWMVRNRMLILHIFLTNPDLLSSVTYLVTYLLVIAVIRHSLKSQVGSGSKSLDLFSNLVIISFTSTADAGQSISPLNIMSTSTETLEVVRSYSWFVVFLVKKLLNLSTGSKMWKPHLHRSKMLSFILTRAKSDLKWWNRMRFSFKKTKKGCSNINLFV